MVKPKKFTVLLKNKETVQIHPDNLKEFLEENSEQIQIQQKKMGKRRIPAKSLQNQSI